jgi:SAM-dependent methyltransferase
VEWSDKTFISSVAMKAQADKFIITGRALEQAGCKLNIHGDGLLPTMWNTPVSSLSEQNKYKLMWQFDAYRDYAPGEHLVDTFLTSLEPKKGELVVDFGCGTGRASVELHKRGYGVYLIDFADNCRDEEAMQLPFLEWDLTRPIPVRSNYGLCTDVMEHIPTPDVAQVLTNILEASKAVLFQISTVKDSFGALLGTELHLTVRDHEWWMSMFDALDLQVTSSRKNDGNSLFIVTRKESINA